MKSPHTGESIPILEYHNGAEWGDLIGSTRFKAFYRDAAAFRWPLPVTESAALDLGSATHMAILDPDALSALLVLPEIPFRSNADKARWQQWLTDFGTLGAERYTKKDEIIAAARATAATQGKTIASQTQIDVTSAMSMSVLECEEACDALRDGRCERSYRADGKKARPDCLSGELLVDLKTCARFDRFDLQAHELQYPSSMAWYDYVLRACGVPVHAWAWIVVESAPYRLASDGIPRHRVKVVVASDDVKMETEEALGSALRLHAECTKNDDWPAEILPTTELKNTCNKI